MQWYEDAPQVLEPGVAYSHSRLCEQLALLRPGLSVSGYHWAIRRLLRDGVLVKCAYAEYSLADGSEKPEFMPTYTGRSELLLQGLTNTFPELDFTLFETMLLNPFLSTPITQNTRFLQVAKASSVSVLRFLHAMGAPTVMLRPCRRDFALYWQPDAVVISDLISESPVCPRDPHRICLEKMLVDICADKRIASTFSRDELPGIFEKVRKSYHIDRVRLLRYARRRSKEEELAALLKGSQSGEK